MRITCGTEVPIAGYTVANLISCLQALPQDAELKSIGFEEQKIRVWWEEER